MRLRNQACSGSVGENRQFRLAWKKDFPGRKFSSTCLTRGTTRCSIPPSLGSEFTRNSRLAARFQSRTRCKRQADVVSGVFGWPLGPLLSGLVQSVSSLTIWQLQTWHHILSECLRAAELTWRVTAGEIVRSHETRMNLRICIAMRRALPIRQGKA